jgi:signal transduction histidine kinase/ligand-binding sensor domain-containing protein
MHDGLPSQAVLAFSETPDGYLWIGTSDGLVRFDGFQFHTYTRQEMPALTIDSILCLLTSRDGTLWIGTDGGGLLQWKDGHSRRVPLTTRQSSPQTDYIRGVYQDSTGTIWVSTDGGLFHVHNGSLERVGGQLATLVRNTNAVLEDRQGRLWVGGPKLFLSDDGKVTEYVLHNHDVRSHIRSMLETQDGSIWAGTVEGLYRLRPGAAHFERVLGLHGTVRSLHEVSSGELWAGTISGGLYIVHNGLASRMSVPGSLMSHTVFSIFKDGSRNIWVGTQTGMLRLSQTAVHVSEMPGTLDSDFGTVSQDAENSLWAVSNEVLHVQDNKAIPAGFPGLDRVRIRTLLRSKDHSLWIGTNGNGLYHVTAKGTIHYDISNGLVNNYIRTLVEARDGSLWVGTDDGVSHIDAHGIHSLTVQDGLTYNSIRALLEDNKGGLWVATDYGVSHRVRTAFVQDAVTDSLSGEKVWSLYQDKEGTMWFGTKGDGLYSYSDGHIAHFTTSNGLVSNAIFCILVDDRNRLWLSTPTALMLMDRNELLHSSGPAGSVLSMRVFYSNEDDRSTEFYGGVQPSGLIMPNGAAYFPATHGLWMVRPDEIAMTPAVRLNILPPVVDGREFSTASAAQQRLVLAASSRRIEIPWKLVYLGPQDDWRFRYRLNGFDKGWIQASNGQRLATYTNLPAGTYQFEVESWRTDRPESTTAAFLPMTMGQFVYQRLWFRLLFVAACLVVLLLLYYLRVRRINDRFRSIIMERNRIAREMHDTLIQGCTSISALLHAASSEEVGDSDSRLHMIQYASTQVLATLDEARQAVAGLRAEAGNHNDLLQTLQTMVDRSRRSHGVETTLDVQGDQFEMSDAAVHALAMIAREAMFNAILHAEAQCIHVTINFLTHEVSIEVKDDGHGFILTAEPQPQHFGIEGMRERVAGLGGTFRIVSAPGAGTSVQVQVPRDRLYVKTPLMPRPLAVLQTR